MKNKDIKAGMQVWTRVSGRKVLVEVLGEYERAGYSGRKRSILWRVKRADNGKLLGPRHGNALHQTKDFTNGKPAPMPPLTGEDCDREEHDAQMAAEAEMEGGDGEYDRPLHDMTGD